MLRDMSTINNKMGLDARKTIFGGGGGGGVANNTGADQPVQMHRLISAFVIRYYESVISKLATGQVKFSS